MAGMAKQQGAFCLTPQSAFARHRVARSCLPAHPSIIVSSSAPFLPFLPALPLSYSPVLHSPPRP